MTFTMEMPAGSPFSVFEEARLDRAKFVDPARTLTGDNRARVPFERLETLWINTGTLCNLACKSCYIESSPTNDSLVYLSLAEAELYFAEARELGTRVIGFTGGEPFMNPEIIAMIRSALGFGFELLILTNAMRPMRRHDAELAEIGAELGSRIVMRVSLDHSTRAIHEAERGADSWDKAIDGLRFLDSAGFRVAVAGRRMAGEDEARTGYAALFAELKMDPDHLVIFPTMDPLADVAEISESCWGLLDVSPSAMMCASSRMVVKARGAQKPHVVACTLLPHDERFALGSTLAGASRPIALNHPHCARFCVLGGASCSG